jgi:hypothetical protein
MDFIFGPKLNNIQPRGFSGALFRLDCKCNKMEAGRKAKEQP